MNSLVPVLLDFQYLICFYATSDGDFTNAGQGIIENFLCGRAMWICRLMDFCIFVDSGRCVEKTWWFRPVVACLPAWFRFMQCLRRYRDSREAFPHLANAGKYSTTFFVILFSTLSKHYKGIPSCVKKSMTMHLIGAH